MFKAIKEFFFGKTPEQKQPEAPYKVEAPVVDLADIAIAQKSAPVNPQCSDSVTQPDGNECKAFPTAVNSQITDAVTQAKPAAMKAKKKPANKKPAGEKKASGKKPGRKPKSAKA